MSRKNEEARMILPKGWKYITVLDYEVGKVFQYKISDYNYYDYEKLLSDYGHRLSSIEWMIHDTNEIIKEDKTPIS